MISAFKNVKRVMVQHPYWLISIAVSFLFFIFNVLITNWNSLVSVFNLDGILAFASLLFIEAFQFQRTIQIYSYISLILISLLLGILASIILFKMKAKYDKEKIDRISTVSIFLGMLAPGCAACGIGLASVLGLSGYFVAFFPYNGLEISVLSIFLLGFSIVKLGKSMDSCSACQVKIPHLAKQKVFKAVSNCSGKNMGD
ncbi:MAG TPA: hypothetical protein VJH97_02565 [Candidatus Nanoarchaeia archaeon]|nr:hypothetical protein [Candidatus Nanoarchaeia archaeon]